MIRLNQMGCSWLFLFSCSLFNSARTVASFCAITSKASVNEETVFCSFASLSDYLGNTTKSLEDPLKKNVSPFRNLSLLSVSNVPLRTPIKVEPLVEGSTIDTGSVEGSTVVTSEIGSNIIFMVVPF